MEVDRETLEALDGEDMIGREARDAVGYLCESVQSDGCMGACVWLVS